jgi:hypothetical protein
MSGTGEGSQAAYYFLPWVRQGAVAAVQPGSNAAGSRIRAPVPLTLRVNGQVTDEVKVPLRLYGPGDVIGIDAREIIRTEPRHLTPDFPPHCFAFIEFDRPDFPWLFTPEAAATADAPLRPWLVLAVVRKQVAQLSVDPRRPLAVLECPLTELPDLAESSAWAHAQFTGKLASDQKLEDALASSPQQTVSRLICPRKLEPRKGGAGVGYLACLVPAFEVGRKAGLGEALTAVDEGTLAPAWDVNVRDASGRQVTLPVYYHWEFNTAEEGDFEELVDRLAVLKQLPDVTPRTMDVSRPAAGLEFPGATLGVESALRPAAAPRQEWPAGLPHTFESFKEKLRAVLEAPNPAATGKPGAAVAPPIYGRMYTGAAADAAASLAPNAAPAWLRELNLDPRYRVAAALGARVVQQQQEQLVAAAWEQAEQLDAVNQWLRQKQLAREVTSSVYEKRLKQLSPTSLNQVLSPVEGGEAAKPRMAAATAATAAPASAAPLREVVGTAVFRRIARPHGPLMRRKVGSAPVGGAAVAQAAQTLVNVLQQATFGKLAVSPPPGASTGAGPAAGLKAQLGGVLGAISNAVSTALTTAATDTKSALLKSVAPQATFLQEAQERIELPPGMAALGNRTEALAPVMVTPSFPQPMYEPLKELFQELLLPGLERVPHNVITLFETNPRFIEAYMVGLNHELSRELLWREFPADLQGTYFRQFWDVRGRLAPTATEQEREALRDILPIKSWRGALGSNMPGSRGEGLLVLLIKGDLLQRYPNALIYAVRARWSKDAAGRDVAPAVIDRDRPPELPVLRVNPGNGVTLLGFNVTRSAAAGAAAPPGDPGYFFVVEEHPTESRFGLDISSAGLTTWRELAWPHVPTREDGSGHITLKAAGSKSPPVPQDSRGAAWGKNGAHMAFITLQKPYRFTIHARFWLAPSAGR